MIVRACEWHAAVAASGCDSAVAMAMVRQGAGEFVDVDHTHADFHAIAFRLPRPSRPAAKVQAGPGTELKKLLARVGISADEPGCQCKSRAAFMDRQGCEWVAGNVDTVVGWLREEAQRRGLPFIDVAGKMLVREALRRARKDAAARAQRPPRDD